MTGLQKSEVMKVLIAQKAFARKKKPSEDSSAKNRPEVDKLNINNGVQQMIWILVSGMTTP